MKKLLYITTNLQGTGGVSRILSVKLNYLIKNYNYSISVINSNNTRSDFFYDFSDRIKFYSLDHTHLFAYKKKLNELINTIEPDIIINCDNGLKGSLFTYLIKSSASLVYERHCSKNIIPNNFVGIVKLKISNFFLEKSIHKYRKFIVLNDSEKEEWKHDNLLVITNPLWFSLPKETTIDNYNVVIAVGRHSYEKRYDKLIDIWEKVVEDHPDWVLKIYGESNKENSLEKLISEKRIANNIELYRPINNVENIYFEASMLLTTSESESFGLVLIEAMAFGVPVIAFGETSGSKTIIDNGVNGFVVNNDDTKTYIEKIKLLMDNTNLRVHMGKNARNSLKSFDIDTIMPLWNDLFNSL